MTITESPLPLWERDRVRGPAPAGAEELAAAGGARNWGSRANLHIFISRCPTRSLRAAALVPSPCLSPTRGEGTLLRRLAPVPKTCASPRAKAGDIQLCRAIRIPVWSVQEGWFAVGRARSPGRLAASPHGRSVTS